MPPKSLIASLLGLSDRTFAGDGKVDQIKSIFDFGLNKQDLDTAVVESKQESAESKTSQFVSPTTPVIRGVLVDKGAPVVSRGDGGSLQIRQLWEGTVTELCEDGFIATLTDKTRPNNPDERAVFQFESIEVPVDDLPLVQPGSVFYWTLGIESKASGQVKNVSTVEFRRLPAWPWTTSSIATASSEASKLRGWLNSKL